MIRSSGALQLFQGGVGLEHLEDGNQALHLAAGNLVAGPGLRVREDSVGSDAADDNENYGGEEKTLKLKMITTTSMRH